MTNTTYPPSVTPDMRASLDTNRDGKLTTQQWKMIVTEPLVTLLLWMVPAIIILRGKLFLLLGAGGGLAGILLLAALAGFILYRAWRYARAPVYSGVFQAGKATRSWWMFWKGETFYNEAGEAVNFHKRLAPYRRPANGGRYLIYYLKDGRGGILLSIAPADHPATARWQPSPAFQTRQAARVGRSGSAQADRT